MKNQRQTYATAGSPWPQIEKLAVKFHGVEIMPSETPSEPDAIMEIVGRFNADRISEAHDAADCFERAVNQLLEENAPAVAPGGGE